MKRVGKMSVLIIFKWFVGHVILGFGNTILLFSCTGVINFRKLIDAKKHIGVYLLRLNILPDVGRYCTVEKQIE